MTTAKHITCEQVVLGFGPFLDSATTTELAKIPERLTSGVDPGNGPPWQVVTRTDGPATAAMHLLLLEQDSDALHPRLGQDASDSAPWLGWDEPGVAGQSGMSRSRTAQGLDMHHHGFQLILAKGRDTNRNAGRSEYLAVLAKNMGTGHTKLYLHDSSLGQWRTVPEVTRVADKVRTAPGGLNEAAARTAYQGWTSSLLDPAPSTGEFAQNPLSTARFGRRIQRNMGIVISGVVNNSNYGPDSNLFPLTQGPTRTTSSNWLARCDQRADRAYSNGLEPMLQIYQEQIGSGDVEPWEALARMVDRLRGQPSDGARPSVVNDAWSPYGGDRVAFLDQALSSIPRRTRKPRADNGLSKTMARGTRVASRAPLRRPRI